MTGFYERRMMWPKRKVSPCTAASAREPREAWGLSQPSLRHEGTCPSSGAEEGIVVSSIDSNSQVRREGGGAELKGAVWLYDGGEKGGLRT